MKNLLFFLLGSLITFMFCYFFFVGGREAKGLINYIDNNYLPGAKIVEKVNKALIDIERVNTYDNYIQTLLDKPDTRRIGKDSANCFYKLYHDRRMEIANMGKGIPDIAKYQLEKDITEAVLIRMDTLMKAIFESYPGIDPLDTHVWDNKGIIIYPSYYGNVGHKIGSTATDMKQTSVIFQMAIDSTLSTPDEWQIIKDKIYNFGGIKPPKTIKWEQITGVVSAGVTCN